MSKIFTDELKTRPNSNYMGVNTVFKIFGMRGWGRRGKTVTLCFGDVILVTNRPRPNTWCFLCSK